MRKKYTKHEELSNLRRPTEEEKQQVKVCVDKRLNCVLRTGNTGNFICIVLALIFFTDTVKLKPSWPITLAVFIALLVFMWVVGRGNMHTLLLTLQLVEQGNYQVAEGKVIKLTSYEVPGGRLAYFENENGERIGQLPVVNKQVEIGTPLKLVVICSDEHKVIGLYLFTPYMLETGKCQS